VAERSVSYAPTEELDLIRSTARHFLAERLPIETVREVMMSEEGFDRGAWKEMVDMGWTGLSISEDLGGAGFGPVETGVLLEEMGRMVTPGPFFASAVLATTAIQEMATEEQKSALLPSLASGEKIASLAMFEGAHHRSPGTLETRATRSGGGWLIEGRKRAVLSGSSADMILVTAATEDGVGVFVVDPDAEGLTVAREPALDPTRSQSSVQLESVAVGESAKLGQGDVSSGLTATLLLASAALASEQAGGAQACMEMSVDYAKTRYQFGRPIGSYQAIKHRCANMLMKVEHARSAAYYAARVTDDREELAVAAPLAASVASEAYVWVAGENIQVHGGIGFTWEHDAHIYLKRAKASSLLLGDPRYQRDLLGRAIGI
jgi:alkylation response protein AidB-like acyl-CoA dehydrogenase